MNEEQCEKLIDQLSDKTLSFGCRVIERCSGEFETGTYVSVNQMHYQLHGVVEITNEPGNGADIKELEDGSLYKVLGHPVYIGDVLEKTGFTQAVGKRLKFLDLLALWKPCGFTKSLNEIMECGFECLGCACKLPHKPSECNEGEALKDDSAKELFEFLNSIFND